MQSKLSISVTEKKYQVLCFSTELFGIHQGTALIILMFRPDTKFKVEKTSMDQNKRPFSLLRKNSQRHIR